MLRIIDSDMTIMIPTETAVRRAAPDHREDMVAKVYKILPTRRSR